MKNKAAIIFLLIQLLFLNSCANGNTKVTTGQSEKQWLQNPVCALPCWQHITPQKTQFNDVMSILADTDSGVALTYRTESEISFQFREDVSGIIQRAASGTVNAILLGVDNVNITLDDVLNILGQPDKVTFGRDLYQRSKCSVSIVFQQKGVVLDLFSITNSSDSVNKSTECHPNIIKDNRVFRIILIGNIEDSEYWKSTPYSVLDYVDWKGYGTYP